MSSLLENGSELKALVSIINTIAPAIIAGIFTFLVTKYKYRNILVEILKEDLEICGKKENYKKKEKRYDRLVKAHIEAIKAE